MKKTRAPLFLFGFLGLMVCCIIASVAIAVKNPVNEDDSYFSSKKHIDEEINSIIQEQNWFLSSCELYLNADEPAKFLSSFKLTPPYLQSPTYSPILRLSSKETHHLFLGLKGKEPKDLVISLYLEKINSSMPKILLGRIDPHQAPIVLPHLKSGRYKAIFEVHYLRNAEEKRIFFEREIFIF